MKKGHEHFTENESVILAGDIGGTKTHLGLYRIDAGRPRKLMAATYPSQESAGLEEMINDILRPHKVSVAAACFGIAGPVIGGACSPTNLSWSVTEENLRSQFGWQKVQLFNDLAAMAIAAPHLAPSVLTCLNRGMVHAGGNIVVIAPGTGLGQALLLSDQAGYWPMASEGGHADFAPNDKKEVELWLFLHQRFGHVSIERVLSGQGLVNIFEWLRSSYDREHSTAIKQAMTTGDPAAVITRHAIDKNHSLCREALHRFCRIFGAVAGNLALTGMATGGVYLGGGIAPKILPALKMAAFMEGFTAKGRFRDFMAAIPVQVICEDEAALIGAAQRAYEIATKKGDNHDNG
jgi:glucokinase